MSFHLAWQNYCFDSANDPGLGMLDGSVIAGAIENLRTPVLADSVTMQETTLSGSCSVRFNDAWQDEREIQVIAILNVETQVTEGATGPVSFSFTINSNEYEFDVPGYSSGFPRHVLLILPAPISGALSVEVNVTAVFASGGTLTASIGALWFGPCLELPVGPLRLRHLEQARSTTTPGGQRHGEDSVTVRELRFDVESMSKELAIGSESTSQDVQQAIQYAGETGAVLAIPFAESAHDRHRLGVYGVMTSTGELVRRSAASWQWSGPVITEQR